MPDDDAEPERHVGGREVDGDDDVALVGRAAWPTQVVDDIDDPRVADFRRLNDAQYRRILEGGEWFVAEGPVPVERLLGSRHRVRALLVAEQKLDRLLSSVEPGSRGSLPAVYVADRTLVNEIVGFDLHRGVVASADRVPHPTVAALGARTRRLVVLEGLNDPENLGLIARSARALGADGMVLDPTCTDPYSRRSVRVSMGEILYLPTARADPADWPAATLATLRDAGFATWAMTPAVDAVDVWTLDVPERIALLFGAEGPGLTASAMAGVDHRVSIPIAEDVDSLNVAASAAIGLAVLSRPTRGRRHGP